MARPAQIKHGQSSMAEADPGLGIIPVASIIRASMDYAAGHGPETVFPVLRAQTGNETTCYAAHLKEPELAASTVVCENRRPKLETRGQ